MSAITTHILDVSTGRPAAGVEVVLEIQEEAERWTSLGRGVTDHDGRLGTLMSAQAIPAPGIYRLIFQTQAYFDRSQTQTFYPRVTVVFTVVGEAHYHVPLLLSPFGYSTYRGT